MFSFAPFKQALPKWPQKWLWKRTSLFDDIGFTDFGIVQDGVEFKSSGTICWLTEIEIPVPWLDAVSLVLLAADGMSGIAFTHRRRPAFEIRILNLSAALRFRTDLLRRVHADAEGRWMPSLDLKGAPIPAEIVLAGIDVVLSADWDVSVVGTPVLSFPTVALGATGLVLEVTEIELCLSEKQNPPAAAQPGFKGIAIKSATLHFTRDFGGATPKAVACHDVLIGSSGFSGRLEASWAAVYIPGSGAFIGNGAGTLFGIPFGLTSLDVSFQQNSPTGGGLKGQVKLPFFDHAIGVEIGFTVDGSFTVGLDSPDGLGHVSIPGVLDLELDSVKFELAAGILTATLSGKLTPTVPGLTWPAIELKDLKIDSEGHVSLPGGWLDLPEQYGFDFHGFQVDITKFGLGRNQNGTKWIGFSGAVKLVDGLPAGASVDGLRITAKEDWSDAKISFDGVGVELDAEAFYFKGDVSYREFEDPFTGQAIRRFDGDIKLKLRSLKLEIDGALVVGSVEADLFTGAPAYNFFAIYVGAQLPTGLPLGTTGLAFYGVEGLVAIEMEPRKDPDEPWYGIGDGWGWYKKAGVGVADLDKWRNQYGSKAFGAGVTLGTYADNGYTFNGKALLAIVFPGPIIMLEGKANLLKDRAELGAAEPLFRSLAVLDTRPGSRSLLIGLDVKYQYSQADGKLIKISAGTEAFYDFDDPTAWHIYLGENEPRERRIQANILSLFEANAYLMLDAHKLAMGAWVGLDRSWQYGPLSVTLQAWLESNAVVSFKPAHLHGDLWAHGAVDLQACGFGTGLTIDARLAADVRDPFHVLGDFDVEFRLPWPFKKKHLGAHVTLEWGPESVSPPLPVALKDVAIEHFKSSTTWPLPLGTLLIPDYADVDGFLTSPNPVPPDQTLAPPTNAPVVPLDCRPSLSFGRNVNDDAQIGIYGQPPNPEAEWIGDPARNQGPARVRYGLSEVRLDRWDGSGWQAVAGKGTAISALPELFGTWAPVPAGTGVAQNKLLLWSKCGFDHLRQAGPEWGDWFAGELGGPGGYPCVPDPAPSFACLDFEKLSASRAILPSPFHHPDNPDVSFSVIGMAETPSHFRINERRDAIDGHRKALCVVGALTLRIDFAVPVSSLHIAVLCPGSDDVTLTVTDSAGVSFGPTSMTLVSSQNFPSGAVRYLTANVAVAEVAHVVLSATQSLCILEVCAVMSPTIQALANVVNTRDHNKRSTARWSARGNVLEPYTNYRLRIVTRVTMTEGFSASPELIQLAYFRTSAPPGLADLGRPANLSVTTEFESGLDDLTRYVEQTIPPTVPAVGQPTRLPRPVYRGYDVGVKFNEDYVDLMYRLAGRDLAIVLYDRNNEPIRDRSGRLVVTDNPWGVTEKVTLNDQEAPWLALVNSCGGCVPPIAEAGIPHDQTLSASDARQILDPDTLYDARLIPLMLHEDFGRIAAGTIAQHTQSLGRWLVRDLMGTGTPSHWEIEEFGPLDAAPRPHRVIQTSGIGVSGNWLGGTPSLSWLGTILVLGDHPGLAANDSSQPPNWSDYRVGLYLRSSADGMSGVAFRYTDVDNFYLFAMDRPNGAHRLLRIKAGEITILADNENSYDLDRDYRVVVEAIGASFRVYLDDALVFDVTDNDTNSSIVGGGIALQCSLTNGAGFSDIQVHDFSKSAKSVYRFPFTTSAFTDFFHHLHSFDDESWFATCTLPDATLAGLSARAVENPNTLTTVGITDEEARAFEALADNVLGPSARQLATRTEFTRINHSNGVDESDDVDAVALLLRMSEPIDWTRISLSLTQASQSVPTALAPLTAKIVAATLGSQNAVDERITLLIRDSTNLTGHRIEKREVANGSVFSLDGTDEAAPAWVPIYEFGSEDTMPAGTRVIVVSGPTDDPPTAEPRTVKRFRAQPGNDGDLQFTSDAVDLRLVGPRGNVMHARRFLGSAAMVGPVGVRLLRKADGTACFILPASPDTSFPEGPFQMTMEFKRDNKAFDPDSLVLSAAGQTTPETAVLDIPWATL